MTHCSSKWDRPIFLEIKSNENGGTDNLSFAFIVPPKENQKHTDIYFDTISIRKMKISRIVKEEICIFLLCLEQTSLFLNGIVS